MNVIGFQTAVSPIMEGIVDLHNHIFFFLVLIFVFVFWLFSNILYRFWWELRTPGNRLELVPLRHLSHNTFLEIVWTIFPSLILVAIAIPSFALLYAMDEVLEPTLTLKAVGHQWYWNFQYSNCLPAPFVAGSHPELVPASFLDRFLPSTGLEVDGNPVVLPAELESVGGLRSAAVRHASSQLVDLSSFLPSPLPPLQFDSYMVAESELPSGSYRLLEVDEPVVLPAHTHIRLLTTSEDVIHSFAVPQLGVKVDAIPGRLNQQGFFIKRLGSFYGQCSELCGVNHGFMPIVVRAVPLREFAHWYLTKLDAQNGLGLTPLGLPQLDSQPSLALEEVVFKKN